MLAEKGQNISNHFCCGSCTAIPFLSCESEFVIYDFIYRVVTDNVDLAVQARHQSKSHQNKSLHWTHSFAVKNRITPDSKIDDSKPQMQVKDLEMIQVLPSQEDQASMKSSMAILVFRVICKYFVAYKEFGSAIIHHIPHEYSREMKEKSEQVLSTCIAPQETSYI